MTPAVNRTIALDIVSLERGRGRRQRRDSGPHPASPPPGLRRDIARCLALAPARACVCGAAAVMAASSRSSALDTRAAQGLPASVSSIPCRVRTKRALPKSSSSEPTAWVAQVRRPCRRAHAPEAGDGTEDRQMAKIGDRGHLYLIPYTALPIAIGAAGAHVSQSPDGVPPELGMSIARTNTPRADRTAVDRLANFGVATVHEAQGRTFIPHRVHEAIGVLGAVSVATACAVPGTVAARIAGRAAAAGPRRFEIEHPTGFLDTVLDTIRAGRRPRNRETA